MATANSSSVKKISLLDQIHTSCATIEAFFKMLSGPGESEERGLSPEQFEHLRKCLLDEVRTIESSRASLSMNLCQLTEAHEDLHDAATVAGMLEDAAYKYDDEIPFHVVQGSARNLCRTVNRAADRIDFWWAAEKEEMGPA